MTADQKKVLRYTLDNLTKKEFKRFIHLLSDRERITLGLLEEADRDDTLELMVQAYSSGAGDVMLSILKEMQQNDLAMKLERCLESLLQDAHETKCKVTETGGVPPGVHHNWHGFKRFTIGEKDQCWKRASQFTETCMKPAVEDYVSKHLGYAIADQMKMGDEGLTYSTQTHYLLCDLLKQRLHDKLFPKYKDYTQSHETYVKNWIKEQIIKKMSSGEQMQRLETALLSEIVKKITATITSISKDMDIEEFISQFCSDLKYQLVFPRDALNNFMILINARTDQFAINLKEFIKEMESHLAQGYANKTGISHITERITQLPSKPHELLFNRLCGCGKQCPFCGTPCEAGGQNHRTHFSSIHRPRAFIGHHWDSKKLMIDICTTSVISDLRFKSSETGDKLHPYKLHTLTGRSHETRAWRPQTTGNTC
ncbi:interferon-induced very large GTPase 1-like [Clupea harengus]|uniref:Interferon-induced very large GTPase 1-like n=1 Tax=Clupea harengus TaxID=7950 RepID=A0A8M1KS16_CLUHA|nr:interferon-induced very large GTPase 1-like [Clupea harengus]